MLDRLAWSEMFESFLASKYTAAKRFGLEARHLEPHRNCVPPSACGLACTSKPLHTAPAEAPARR